MTLFNFYSESLGGEAFYKNINQFESVEVYQEFRRVRNLNAMINRFSWDLTE